MCTTRPVRAAAVSKSVCRQRKAGICSTSATRATGAACAASWMSVTTGTPTSSFTACSTSRPASRPGPRKLSLELRLALSKLALKTNGMSRSFAMALMARAIFTQCSRDSMTLGPAMRKNGRAARSAVHVPIDAHATEIGEDTRTSSVSRSPRSRRRQPRPRERAPSWRRKFEILRPRARSERAGGWGLSSCYRNYRGFAAVSTHRKDHVDGAPQLMRPTCPPSLRRYEFGSLHVEDVLVGRVRLQLVHFDFVQEVARSKRECRPLLLTVPA